MAAIYEDTGVTELQPQSGFVIKSKVVAANSAHAPATKVFINVCHDLAVPRPDGPFDPAVVFPKIVENEWEVPIIVSLEKTDTDKKGVPALVYDCVVNSECYTWVQVSRDLRLIVIEWCMESVEMMHDMVLDRDYTLPKLACKGELSHTTVPNGELRQGIQKKLAQMKEAETEALLGLDVAPDSPQELPDLRNIAGSKPKPLIQEVTNETKKTKEVETNEPMEMDLDEEEEQSELRARVENTTPLSFQNELIEDTSRPLVKKIRGMLLDLSLAPTAYEFTLSQKKTAEHHVVVFESAQMTSQLRVTFDGQLRLENDDTSRKLGATNTLDLPTPEGFVPYRAFAVGPKLYIFSKAQTT